MPSGHIHARRANLDDLQVLRGLWQLERLPYHELEKRLTEFHIAARADGVVTGAIGFVATGQQALVHSPAFASHAQAEEAWPVLWDHLLTLARSQSVIRIWMNGHLQDSWRETGFKPATGADLKKLPARFGAVRGEWHTLVLRDEAAVAEALEKEFETFHEVQQQEAERLRRQAIAWKLLAWIIALIFFIGAGWMLLLLLRAAPRRTRRL